MINNVDDLGNPEAEYKIFLAPSASATDSPAIGCDIVPKDAGGISSSGSLAVSDKPLLYSNSECWSSTYGSYTGVVKYYRKINDGTFVGIGQDKIITCKLDFADIELTEKYSINFFGGFRPVSEIYFLLTDVEIFSDLNLRF